MLPKLINSVRRAAMISGELEPRPLHIPLEWTTTGFDCTINHFNLPAESADSAGTATGPVRPRVSKAEADSCMVEIFCAEARLFRVSAGC